MANETKNFDNNSNQTMKHEQAKASVGGERNEERGQNEQGRMNEQGSQDQNREKSAIGGGQSETGEPGRARSELDQNNQNKSQTGEFDKNRTETTSR